MPKFEATIQKNNSADEPFTEEMEAADEADLAKQVREAGDQTLVGSKNLDEEAAASKAGKLKKSSSSDSPATADSSED